MRGVLFGTSLFYEIGTGGVIMWFKNINTNTVFHIEDEDTLKFVKSQDYFEKVADPTKKKEKGKEKGDK